MTDWLVDTLVATSALMALVLVLRQPVRDYFGSRTAYALWLLPAARVLMPTITETVKRTIPAPQPVAIEPFAPTIGLEPQLLPAVSAPQQTLLDALGGWPTIALFVWLGVALGLIARGIGDFRRQREEILSGSVQLARLGSIRMVRSPAVNGPMAFGLIDRVIAVPCDFERRYDERERSLALDHELAHHRHGDLYTNSFAFVLLSLQWFNPLAWWSYAAFRFDQEAACDARVLDKASQRDRADYGRAIAKAASGRALLLASALDQKKTLHRRLKSMLTNTPKSRRIVGTALIVAAVAVALPLTATRAINYQDSIAPLPPEPTDAPQPVAPAAPAAPMIPAALAPDAPLPPVPPVPPAPPALGKDSKIIINGKELKWSELSPEQKAEIRAAIARARQDIAEHRIDREQMRRDMEKAMSEAKFDRAELQRDLAEARLDIDQALRVIDANAAELRKHGQDPEALKAIVLSAMRTVDAIDIEKITRDAMASVNPKVIEASMVAAEQAMARAQAEIDRIDVETRGD